jgi:hypothetical protein
VREGRNRPSRVQPGWPKQWGILWILYFWEWSIKIWNLIPGRKRANRDRFNYKQIKRQNRGEKPARVPLRVLRVLAWGLQPQAATGWVQSLSLTNQPLNRTPTRNLALLRLVRYYMGVLYV